MINSGEASEKNHGVLVIQTCNVLVMTWNDDHFAYMTVSAVVLCCFLLSGLYSECTCVHKIQPYQIRAENCFLALKYSDEERWPIGLVPCFL